MKTFLFSTILWEVAKMAFPSCGLNPECRVARLVFAGDEAEIMEPQIWQPYEPEPGHLLFPSADTLW